MSRLGLIADTHDQLLYIKLATDLFASKACDTVVHAGDIESPEGLKAFASLTEQGVRLYWILGDDDHDQEALKRTSNDIGATCVHNLSPMFETQYNELASPST